MSAKIAISYYKSPVGELIIGLFQGKLCICDWRYRKSRSQIDKRIQESLNAEFEEQQNTLHKEVINQMEAYFSSGLQEFDLDLLMVGSNFQKKVWKALLTIPYGKTMSYLELSKSCANEKAIRAVASANGANSLAIIVPCHRVIGSKGELTGFAGGLTAKKFLLDLESPLLDKQMELF